MNNDDTVRVYTDGACSGNPGPGGWGVVVKFQDCESELSGYNPHTTNNQMELQAAISALDAIPSTHHVILSTDSNYVKDGITKWIHNWIKNGWKTAARKPVKNVELWQQLHQLSLNRSIAWEWVKGHSGHPENERADALATGEIQKNR